MFKQSKNLDSRFVIKSSSLGGCRAGAMAEMRIKSVKVFTF
jgi:hypothetical protein